MSLLIKVICSKVQLILLFVSRLTPLSVDRTMIFEYERWKNVHPIHPNWGRTDSSSLCLWRYYGTTRHFSCLWSTPLQSSCYFFNTCEFLSQSISLTHCITHMKYFCFEKLAGYLSPMILRPWAFTFLCVRTIFVLSVLYKKVRISIGFECVIIRDHTGRFLEHRVCEKYVGVRNDVFPPHNIPLPFREEGRTLVDDISLNALWILF